MARSRITAAALGMSVVGAATLTLAAPLAAKAAPSPSSVTVHVGDGGSNQATVSGGPVSGQGDNGLGQPLNPCPPGACESFTIDVVAPAGYTVTNQVALTVSTATTTPVPPNPQAGTIDTYLEDAAGNILGADTGSQNPSVAGSGDVQPGTYTLLVAGSTGADNSYVATVTATSSPRPAPIRLTGGAPITFGVPAPVDPIHGVGEPDIAVSRAGDVFVSGPAGTGEQRSLWWSSVDGGNTYRVIEPIAEAANPVVSTPNLPGGGDTDIAFDNQTPQKQYFSDLTALTSIRQVTTANEGASESQTQNEPGTGEVDRQWFAVYDPPAGVTSTSPAKGTHPIIYQEYNGVHWERSTDGLNFTSASPSSPFGPDGYPSIDQVTGDVFQANYSGSTIKLNIGKPNDAAGDLTFLDDSGQPGLITVATGVDNSGDVANFVASSMDSARNLYVVWVARDSSDPTKRQAFVAAAPADNATPYSQDPAHVPACSVDCWNHWTAPVQVSDGQAATGDAVNIFPWIKAGGPGRADAVWYGDQAKIDPSATCTPFAAGCHVWNVFMDQTIFPTTGTGAITGAAPTTNLVKVTPHPMDYEDVCLSGTGCIEGQGNRNLADFFQVNIDGSGAAEIVYDDMSNNLIQAGSNNAADHAGLPLPTVIRQNGGPGLHGTAVSGPSTAPTSGLSDAHGDALYPVVGGTNVPAMDLTNVSLSLDTTGTLTATLKVADLTQLSSVPTTMSGGTLQQFLVRWEMNHTLYYAEATFAGSMTGAQFSAGQTSSVDLCSVSACRPLVAVYGESANAAAGQATESGTATCPSSPSATNPCTITITVNGADVGAPTSTSLLEEVGGYAYASSHPQSGTTNAEAEVDNVPLEIDGVCCFNFQANSPSANVPEFPWTPGALGLTALLTGVALARRRRRGVRSTAEV